MNLFIGLISLTFFIYLFFIAATYFAYRKVLAL
jgi:cbb3-type cytochrome oxidase subunit 3